MQIGKPPASNMKVLKYSLDLEVLAGKWASQCQGGHPASTVDKRGKYYGQNAAYFDG